MMAPESATYSPADNSAAGTETFSRCVPSICLIAVSSAEPGENSLMSTLSRSPDSRRKILTFMQNGHCSLKNSVGRKASAGIGLILVEWTGPSGMGLRRHEAVL